MAADKVGIDGLSAWLGIRWDSATVARLEIRPDLINPAGLLAGPVSYALIDYCMGSALFAQTEEHEAIATLNISINYVKSATEGEIVCTTQVDRRTRSTAVLRSEVSHADGTLMATAVGSYVIFPRRERSSGALAV
jgi:acyl-CoA thioesterase